MRLLKIMVLLGSLFGFMMMMSVPAMAADNKPWVKKGTGVAPVCAAGRVMEAGLCYLACGGQYPIGVGPVCWKKCRSGYKDDGAVCRKDADIFAKDSYGRGVGRPMPCGGNYPELDAALCYVKCRDGYVGRGPVCWRYCPEGYKDDGGTCRKDAEIYKKENIYRGMGIAPNRCPADKPVLADDLLCYPL